MSGLDELYGTTAIATLRSYAGQAGSASLGIRTAVLISGLRSDFIVLRDGKVWHETNDAQDALKAYRLAIDERAKP